jgi:hypothetical protein
MDYCKAAFWTDNHFASQWFREKGHFRLYLVCLLNVKMAIEGLLVGDRFANRAELILGKQHEADMLLNPADDCLALDIIDFMLAPHTAQDTETSHMICSTLKKVLDATHAQADPKPPNRKRRKVRRHMSHKPSSPGEQTSEFRKQTYTYQASKHHFKSG